MEEAKINEWYKYALSDYHNYVCACSDISINSGGILVNSRLKWASHLFTKLCGTSTSIL
jgi:hypothetical protein